MYSILSAFWIVAAVQAPTATPVAETAAAAAAAAQADKKICRRDNTGTGSIMAKRVCHTKSEWDQLSQRASSKLDQTRDEDQARQQIGTSLSGN
jgi:hypothetical protein